MENYITEYMELPKDVYLPKNTPITSELIGELLKVHDTRVTRYQTLQDYYEGKAAIQGRVKDDHKPNNKLVQPYPAYIVDILLGLLFGNPVSYTVSEDNKESMEQVQEVFDYNEEQDENTELGKMAGIKGRAYEIVYQDEEGKTGFNEVEPENIMIVYDDSIKPKPLFALYITYVSDIKNLTENPTNRLVTVYTKNQIIKYQESNGSFALVDLKMHPFKEVPVIEYLNNDEGIGDFERVLPLIDAMNKSQSDTANDFEEFTDALLILYGMLYADNMDIQQLIDDGVILVDKSDGSIQGAEWLVKTINDTALENFKERIDRDIHKFAKVPNMSDEKFAGNVSGEAMKYKLFATDQVIAQKQRKFKSGLQKRIRLIMRVLNIKTKGKADYRDISIVFNDNKPYNELDEMTVAKMAKDIGMSDAYVLGKLRDIDDVGEEKYRQEEDMHAYTNKFRRQVNEVDDEDEEE